MQFCKGKQSQVKTLLGKQKASNHFTHEPETIDGLKQKDNFKSPYSITVWISLWMMHDLRKQCPKMFSTAL